MSISRMPGPPVGTLVADDHHVAGVDLAAEDGLAGLLLGVKARARGRCASASTGSTAAFLTMPPSGAMLPCRTRRAPTGARCGLSCVRHDLAVGGLGAALEVLGHGAHAGEGARVEQAELGQLVHDHRHAAHGVQVDERARAGGLELHQVRGACADAASQSSMVMGQPASVRDGGEVQHRVGGAAEGHVALHGVVDGGRGDDVA